MKDFIWFLIAGSYLLLVYIMIATISWSVFYFIDNDVLHSLMTFLGVLFFHKKLIFKGTL